MVVGVVAFALGMAFAYHQDTRVYKPYMDKLLACEDQTH